MNYEERVKKAVSMIYREEFSASGERRRNHLRVEISSRDGDRGNAQFGQDCV